MIRVGYSTDARISVSDALNAFAGIDATKHQHIARAADAISCTAYGGSFHIGAGDFEALKAFVAHLDREFRLVGILPPERAKPDAVSRDYHGERLVSTGEPV